MVGFGLVWACSSEPGATDDDEAGGGSGGTDRGTGGSSPGGMSGGGETSSTGGSSSPVVAGEGESCGDTVLCDVGLGCIDGTCAPVGGLDEPCDPVLDVCDEGLMCSEGVCKEFVNVRFCHCVFSNGGEDAATLLLTLDGIEYPPTSAGVCSACVRVPFGGELPYSVETIGGQSVDSGTLEIEDQTPGVFFITTSSQYGTDDDVCEREDDSILTCD